jgi:hypothetical protein
VVGSSRRYRILIKCPVKIGRAARTGLIKAAASITKARTGKAASNLEHIKTQVSVKKE